jgi:DNA-binding MarR family transcriptional regulator
MSAGRGAEAEEAFRLLERELGFLLRRARALQARTATQLHPDLEPASLGLLALLQDEGPLRASDLVVRLGLDKSTVSRQVNSLVELGLVDREPDPDDGRAQVLRPSASGAERLSHIRTARRSYLRSELADWPAEDIAALGSLLARFNRTMGQALAEGRAPVEDRPAAQAPAGTSADRGGT